jgi:nickel transport protein
VPAAWALSEDEVARRLGSVPVFTIMLANGQPLVVFPSDGQGTANRPLSEGRVIHFFNPNDAQAMLASLQRRNPEAMTGSSILVSSLGEVYQRQRSPGQANRPQTSYWPLAAQNDAAINLIRAENPGELGEDVIFPGIPLFTATQGNTDNFLTIQENNREVVPLFFRREDLDALLSRFRQVQPALINNAQIQVINLETLITELEQGRDGDPFVNRARLIPSREALEFIQSIQAEQQGQAPASPAQP